jgi:hypothetical protein
MLLEDGTEVSGISQAFHTVKGITNIGWASSDSLHDWSKTTLFQQLTVLSSAKHAFGAGFDSHVHMSSTRHAAESSFPNPQPAPP